MRKNAPRKWLHAVLDLLPVILIPVFMIYSHRHTIDSYEVQYAQNKVVDFNQQIGNLNEIDITLSNVDVSIKSDNFVILNGSSGSISASSVLKTIPGILNHVYVVKDCFMQIQTDSLLWVSNVNSPDSINWHTSTLFTFNTGYYLSAQVFIMDNAIYNYQVFYPQLFDLTQMFGAGNEPTLEQFNTWYPNDYYGYTLSHKELLKGYSTETLNDTDILSQFTYNLYNSVDKYFNMNNIFGFNNLYDWFILNVFNGNAPLYVYIVWNIILYEFIMDLLFLLYAVFMFLIDVCTHLIEKVFDSGRGS